VPILGSGKSRIRPFFGNPAKSASGQIWRVPVQLQYVPLITDKTNADDLQCGVFAILISVTRTKNTEFICRSTNFAKTGKQ